MSDEPVSIPGRDSAAGDASPAEALTSLKILWPILLSLLVLGVIGYYTFDPSDFREILAELNPWLLAAAVGTVVVRVITGGWRLNYISKGQLGPVDGIRGQLAWDFFSNVTPSAIGGAPFAAVFVARDRGIQIGEATSILLFAMLLDQLWFAITIPVVIAASFFMEVIPREIGSVGAAAFMLYFVGMLLWVVLFGYATVFRPDLLERFADWVFRVKWLRRFRERVAYEMEQLKERAKILRSQPARFYVTGILITLVTWASRYFLVFFVVWSVYGEFDKVLLILRTAALMLGTVILPTPGGSGGIEGLYALLIGPMIPAAAVAPTLLTFRVLGYYVFVALGILLSTHHVQKTMRRKRREARAPRDEHAAVNGTPPEPRLRRGDAETQGYGDVEREQTPTDKNP